MIKVTIITNIPSPYRVDFFYYLQNNQKAYDFSIIYSAQKVYGREWTVKNDKIKNSYFLDAKEFVFKGNLDHRSVHVSFGVFKILREIGPDVVVAMEYNPVAIQCLSWCKIHEKPYISWTDGTLYSERTIGKLQKLTRKIVFKYADAHIASSTRAKEKILTWGVQEEKIRTCLLTVDREPFQSLIRDEIPGRILYVGSFVKRKGLDLLFKALQNVECEWQLHIVGNGSEEEKNELKRLSCQLRIEDCITYCGFLEGKNLLEEYRKASIFILPTREDCFGLVLLEAMFAGTPIISSKYADGAYDIVQEGKNGIIIDPFQTSEFAKSIANLLLDEKKRKDFSEYSMKHSQKFYFENVSAEFFHVIENVLNK